MMTQCRGKYWMIMRQACKAWKSTLRVSGSLYFTGKEIARKTFPTYLWINLTLVKMFFRWSSSNNPVTLRACSRLASRGRGRVVRGRGRGGASGWLASRSVVPASAVPEELIAQAQVVLQDKSRAAIVRELQRTVSFQPIL